MRRAGWTACMNSDQSAFRETHDLVAGHDEVVEDPDIHQAQRGLQRLREVLDGGCLRRAECARKMPSCTVGKSPVSIHHVAMGQGGRADDAGRCGAEVGVVVVIGKPATWPPGFWPATAISVRRAFGPRSSAPGPSGARRRHARPDARVAGTAPRPSTDRSSIGRGRSIARRRRCAGRWPRMCRYPDHRQAAGWCVDATLHAPQCRNFNCRETGTRLAPANPRKQKSQQAPTC